MKVLCAVDHSDFSRHGAESLAALATRPPDEVTLLHVVDPVALKPPRGGTSAQRARWRAALDREGRTLLQRLAQTASTALHQAATAPHTTVRTALARGEVVPTILRQADRRRANLVMVNSRGLSDVPGFLLGSVARKVAMLATQPVLVLKRPLSQLARVVLAVDGSKQAQRAADFLRSCLLPESARLTVLTVVDSLLTEVAARVLSPTERETLMAPARNRAATLTLRVRDAFLKDGFAVTTDVLEGHPAQTIVDYADRSKADLVVVGSRGVAGTERLLLGSVSETVLKYAPCAVLIVHR